MSPLTQSLAPLALASLLVVPAVQKRAKKLSAEDFPRVVEAASTSWKEGKYGAAVGHLKDALALATEKRTTALRAALPKPPEGWTIEEEKRNAQVNAMTAAMSASVGTIVDQTYRQDSGRGYVKATLTADSPMVKMVSATLSNPALLGADGELIEYNAHKAVLRKERNGSLKLQIVLFDAHIVEVAAREFSEDDLFKLFDQAAVDTIARVLAN